jgi:hypothetical protein
MIIGVAGLLLLMKGTPGSILARPRTAQMQMARTRKFPILEIWVNP